jgi:hypothetical protein
VIEELKLESELITRLWKEIDELKSNQKELQRKVEILEKTEIVQNWLQGAMKYLIGLILTGLGIWATIRASKGN